MRYTFNSLSAIAEYLINQAQGLEVSAMAAKGKNVKALYKREAVAYRHIAGLLQQSKIEPDPAPDHCQGEDN